MAKRDPEIRAHKDWMGLLQPTGLVVSPPALVKHQVLLNANIAALQHSYIALLDNPPTSVAGGDDEPYINDFVGFARGVLGWELEDFAGAQGGPELPEGLELALPDFGETLRPSFVVVDSFGKGDDKNKPLLLVKVIDRGLDMDAGGDDSAPGWSASPQVKFERLLREVKVPAGLLVNGDAVRLVYAPSGESSGHLTFPVPGMCEVAGRPILAALEMLLSTSRLVEALAGKGLVDILADSRKYQAEVSNALSDQVLGALWELLGGFQAAESGTDGIHHFDQSARNDPQHIYGGQLTLLMRLIFVLYAEDEGLMPKDGVYANNYSVGGLFNRLRADAGRYPDTMDQRFGAYAWLLSLFRLVFDGGGHGGMRLPSRHGQLFNPDEYPFLEGRPQGVGRVMGEKFEAPRVSDGCIYRVLDALLMLDVDGDGVADRLSYRALDVEQIGSVYEAMMGYEVERAFGPSVAVKPKHIVVNVEELLSQEGGKRKKWLKEHGDCDLTGASVAALKGAETPQEVIAALGRRVSPRSLDASGLPRLMMPGSLYLQPGEERRRTGSHYTPRELTEPIVRTTLRPVIEALGPKPTPREILNLKVCDPAMGSGAFLVEVTRQLAEHLVIAWDLHNLLPTLPADEEPILHARRLVAQRCIYGVDKNPFAVNLAKLSIWLVTLARDHAFTFLDHSLKYGDSLVGLTKKQIAAFHWKEKRGLTMDLFEEKLKAEIEEALGWRTELQSQAEGDYDQRSQAYQCSEEALADARMIGDLCIAAYFNGENNNKRESRQEEYRSKLLSWQIEPKNRYILEGIVEDLRGGEKPLPPLHWEIEFPEVFGRENPGFDAMVGNPPFLGGRRITELIGGDYNEWATTQHAGSTGGADLVAHFFRRAFHLLRRRATFGLIATNSISQGVSRTAGLTFIHQNDGRVYHAKKRVRWPGQAAVVVSVVHVAKALEVSTKTLNGRVVPLISAFLLPLGPDDDPTVLSASTDLAFQGDNTLGRGFNFDDSDIEASSLSLMNQLIAKDARNAERIFPYIDGANLNNSPTHAPSRYVICFGEMSEEEARRWPDLMEILYEKVFPMRSTKDVKKYPRMVHEWWKFWNYRENLYSRLKGLSRALVIARVSDTFAPTFLPSRVTFHEKLVVFPIESCAALCSIHSRVHEAWARFLSSSLKDDLQYTPSKCVRTFPFPENWQTAPNLEAAGKTYYEFRADLMANKNKEGLTKTYNRFHDPNNHEPDIVKLRELHAAMDRAVLDAYGWDDISTDCEFLLDYEIDEETWGNKKRPYRYRWHEAVHDEVLARLLDLNQKRYEEEVAAGLHDKKGKKKSTQKAKPAVKAQTTLSFDHKGGSV